MDDVIRCKTNNPDFIEQVIKLDHRLINMYFVINDKKCALNSEMIEVSSILSTF